MKCRYIKRWVAIGTPSLLLTWSASAQDLLNPLVVTASRDALPLAETAYTSHVMGQDFFSDNNRRNLPDALTLSPGILSQKTTYGHGSPFIRGMTGRSNLLMIDGVRINKSNWRGGPIQYWSLVDAMNVDRVELIKSQGSVPYGSDAMGGTLNVLTQSSSYADQALDQWFFHGASSAEYRSNGEGSSLGRVQLDVGQGKRWGLQLGTSLKEFGDIRDSAVGTMKHTGYPEQDWDLRFDAQLDPDTTLTVAHQSVDQDDVWRWHRTVFNPGWNHEGHKTLKGTYLANIYQQERTLSYVKVDSAVPTAGSWVQHWSATLSYQSSYDQEFQDRRSKKSDAFSSTKFQQLQTADLDTYGVDLELESNFGPGKWVYGLDFYRDEVQSDAQRNVGAGYKFKADQRPVADDSSYDLLGVHAQYHWQASAAWRVESGVRHTHAAADIGKRYDANLKKDVTSQRDWDNDVLSLRAIHDVNDTLSIYGGVAEAFRAPNLQDLSGATTAKSGVESGGSVDLEPEKSLTYEVGSRWGGESVVSQVALFYTNITDIITDVPVSNAVNSPTKAANGREGYIWGVEWDGAWQLDPQWSLSAFAAWQRGQTETSKYDGGPIVTEPYSRALPLTASMALRWTSAAKRYWIEGRLLAAAEESRMSASDIADNQRFPSGGTPSYLVPMLHAGWKASDNVELTLGLENITDVDYRHHGSGNNEPGFNAIFGVKTHW